jgi:hypothetical protein
MLEHARNTINDCEAQSEPLTVVAGCIVELVEIFENAIKLVLWNPRACVPNLNA